MDENVASDAVRRPISTLFGVIPGSEGVEKGHPRNSGRFKGALGEANLEMAFVFAVAVVVGTFVGIGELDVLNEDVGSIHALQDGIDNADMVLPSRNRAFESEVDIGVGRRETWPLPLL